MRRLRSFLLLGVCALVGGALLLVSAGAVAPAAGSAASARFDSRVVYSTYLGGPQGAWASGIGVDSAGNAYVAGSLGNFTSNGNPLALQPDLGAMRSNAAGGIAGFVTKLSPNGNAIRYNVRLPGTVTAIAVDSRGDAYVTGFTRVARFPTRRALQSRAAGGMCARPISGFFPCFDAFVTKLDPAGRIVYSTYLGGRWNDGGTAIAVDRAGAAYIAGFTNSPDFPLVHPLQQRLHNLLCPSSRPSWPACAQAFVAKLSPAGNRLLYSTYLGGSAPAFANAIVVDSVGHAYVTGVDDIGIGNRGFDFPRVHFLPTRPGSMFVTKLSADGRRLLFSSTLAGTGWSIAIGGAGDVYVASHAFVLKLTPDGQKIVYRRHFGGESWSIAVDGAGRAYLAGLTVAAGFANVHPVQPPGGGSCSDEGQSLPCPDAFVIELDPSGQRMLFGSHLGGSTAPEEGTGVAVRGDSVYVVGYTGSRDFPTVHAIQPRNPSASMPRRLPGISAFIVRITPSRPQK